MGLKDWVVIAMVAAAVGSPTLAWASDEFGDNDDSICLVSQGGVNKACVAGGTPHALDVPYDVGGGGVHDVIRVRSSSDCTCTCSGAGIGLFAYNGDLEIRGEADHDWLYGAHSGAFQNTLIGGGTYDYIRGGSGDADFLSGEGGADVMYDPGGNNEQYDGGGDYDTMRDSNCDYDNDISTCGLQGGSMYSCNWIAGCDTSTSSFTLTCPPP